MLPHSITSRAFFFDSNISTSPGSLPCRRILRKITLMSASPRPAKNCHRSCPPGSARLCDVPQGSRDITGSFVSSVSRLRIRRDRAARVQSSWSDVPLFISRLRSCLEGTDRSVTTRSGFLSCPRGLRHCRCRCGWSVPTAFNEAAFSFQAQLLVLAASNAMTVDMSGQSEPRPSQPDTGQNASNHLTRVSSARRLSGASSICCSGF
jgi:hypothetical protein